jgi:hypothetical protein
MKVVTNLSGQTYIEEGEGDNWRMIPAHIWIENQVAVSEIAKAFQLLYEQRHSPRFKLFLYWLLARLEKKYADRWPKLFEAYLESPDAQSLILEMDIHNFLKSQSND